MKKLLALLLAFLLALPSGFALAEKDKTGLWDKAGESLNELWDKAQKTAEDTTKALSEKATEIAGQAQEMVGDTAKAISEKAAEIAGQAQEMVEDTAKAISEKAAELPGQAQEMVGDTAKAISEKATEIAGQAQDIMDELSIRAQIGALKLAGKALRTWSNIQDAVKAGKEKAAELIDLAKEKLPEIWEKIKTVAANSAASVKEFIQEKLQQLLDWIKGTENTGDQTIAPRILYFDVFYFGMPLSEAKLLGIGPSLGDPVADEENGVQYWLVRFADSQDTAMIVFNGLGKEAPLTEIIYTVIDGKGAGTVTEENAANVETTDEVYSSITAWFSGEQAISLDDGLLLPIYPGVLDAGSMISRVRMFLFADGNGYDAATHFVLTGENGAMNMVQFQYLNPGKLEALLAD